MSARRTGVADLTCWGLFREREQGFGEIGCDGEGPLEARRSLLGFIFGEQDLTHFVFGDSITGIQLQLGLKLLARFTQSIRRMRLHQQRAAEPEM